jgi:3-methylcrotonyl-CoA carboxylase beta subunit
VSRGKLLPRDRVMRLLDPARRSWRWARSPPTASTATRRGAGVITGIGRVSGREVLIVANDATVKGGPISR